MSEATEELTGEAPIEVTVEAPTETPKKEPRHESPYVGLMPYKEEDAPFFFGREDEREIITSNLMASRLTLLYGASGVGKSSVLRAGVVNQLQKLAQRDMEDYGTPEYAVVIYDSWVKDPIEGLAEAVRLSIEKLLRVKELEPVPPTRDLSRMLKAWTDRFGLELLIIFDQFEEYFLYHPEEGGEGTFTFEFPRAVNCRELPARFIISMREDTLSRLDRFKASIANLFDNRLQIKYLEPKAARSAIEGPIGAYNEYVKADGNPFSIQPQLVEEVLKQVSQVPSELSPTGQGAGQEDPTQLKIETPYLQLVMTRIWDEEMRKGSHTLRLETLTALGGATQIVQTHLNSVMKSLSRREQDVAASFFHYLVTPVGTKVAHTVPSLAEYTGKKEQMLKPVLDTLASGKVRIIKNVVVQAGNSRMPGYEIYHDALAPAILKWREKHNVSHARRRIIKGAIFALLAVGLIFLGAAYLGYRRLEQAKTEEVQAAEKAVQVETNERAELLDDKAELLDDVAELRDENQNIKKLIVNDIVEKVGSEKPEERRHGLELLQKAASENALTPEDKQKIKTDILQKAPPDVVQRAQAYIAKVPDKADPLKLAELKPRVYLHIQDDAQRASAANVRNMLAKAGFIVPGIEEVGQMKMNVSEVRYFRRDDQPAVADIIKVLKEAGINARDKYIPGNEDSSKIRPKHYEVWFSGDAFGSAPAPDTYKPTTKEGLIKKG